MGTAMAQGGASPPARSFRRRVTSSAAVLLPLPGTPPMATMYLRRVWRWRRLLSNSSGSVAMATFAQQQFRL